MTTYRDIADLMADPAEPHDLDWLKQALQAALQLELATIPPYLCALWSISDTTSPVRDLITGVVLEEMLHMGLACNMLNTIGGSPKINTPEAVPRYPGPLPGRVRPGLIIPLKGLTKDGIINIFLEIEKPEGPPIVMDPAEGFRAAPLDIDLGQEFATIGAFYGAVLEAFQALPPGTINGERQLTAAFSTGVQLFTIRTLKDVETAIGEIRQQGEGTPLSPFSSESGPLAHYYRFSEIVEGRKLIETSPGHFRYAGDDIPFPSTYPMAETPPEGYLESTEFDRLFTHLLNSLQVAWETGDQKKLSQGIGAMFRLEGEATRLMQIPRPDGAGNLGPCFRLSREAAP